MSWYEYLLRCKSHERQKKDKWEHTRFIAFHALWSASADPKRLPKTLEQFMPLNGGRNIKRASTGIREQFLEEYKEYLSKV